MIRSVSISVRTWTTIVVLGLVGQLAWTVENMYLNVFVYDTITDDPSVIAILVASSAAAATLATMLIGAASDRARTRRPFIAVGYMLWGATTATFGFVRPEAIGDIAPTAEAVALAVVAIVVLDCVMTVFGSGANDAAFNAWVTDSTVPANRGRVDGVLSIMPLMGMLLVFGALDGLTRQGEWELFFGVVGAVTALVGLIALFIVRDPHEIRATPDGYLASVVHGLRPSVVAHNPQLYLVLLAYAIIGTSTQIFLPFLIIYIQRYLRIEEYALLLGAVLILAAVMSVLGGRVIDRVGKLRAVLPATGIMAAGLAGMFVARQTLAVGVAGTVMMGGMMLTVAALAASVRDATPTDRVGMVQGLRMIAAVLIPMVIGPFIGAAVIEGANETYEELGVIRQVPTPSLFIAAIAVASLVVIPVLLLRRRQATEESTPARQVAR